MATIKVTKTLLTSHTMADRESWRDVLTRIMECPLCPEYENKDGQKLPVPTGWTNLGEGPEPCECNPWGMLYSPLKEVIEWEQHERLTAERIEVIYYEAKAAFKRLDEEVKKDDAR